VNVRTIGSRPLRAFLLRFKESTVPAIHIHARFIPVPRSAVLLKFAGVAIEFGLFRRRHAEHIQPELIRLAVNNQVRAVLAGGSLSLLGWLQLN